MTANDALSKISHFVQARPRAVAACIALLFAIAIFGIRTLIRTVLLTLAFSLLIVASLLLIRAYRHRTLASSRKDWLSGGMTLIAACGFYWVVPTSVATLGTAGSLDSEMLEVAQPWTPTVGPTEDTTNQRSRSATDLVPRIEGQTLNKPESAERVSRIKEQEEKSSPISRQDKFLQRDQFVRWIEEGATLENVIRKYPQLELAPGLNTKDGKVIAFSYGMHHFYFHEEKIIQIQEMQLRNDRTASDLVSKFDQELDEPVHSDKYRSHELCAGPLYPYITEFRHWDIPRYDLVLCVIRYDHPTDGTMVQTNYRSISRLRKRAEAQY